MHIKKTHYQFLLVMSLFVLSCVISSCSYKKQPSTNRSTLALIKRASIEAQSQHTDIPIPIGCRLIKKHNTIPTSKSVSESGCTTFLHYTTQMSLTHTITFYINEMERSGWDIINLSTGTNTATDNEGMLVCSKPSKSCIISIRSPQKKSAQTSIRLFIKNT